MDGFSIPENLEQKKALKIEQKKDKRKGKKLKERY